MFVLVAPVRTYFFHGIGRCNRKPYLRAQTRFKCAFDVCNFPLREWLKRMKKSQHGKKETKRKRDEVWLGFMNGVKNNIITIYNTKCVLSAVHLTTQTTTERPESTETEKRIKFLLPSRLLSPFTGPVKNLHEEEKKTAKGKKEHKSVVNQHRNGKRSLLRWCKCRHMRV
jgi:hypothetical protein